MTTSSLIPEGHTLRVLILEQSATEGGRIETELHRAGFTIAAQRVDTREGFSTALATSRPQIILSETQLRDFTALDALAILNTGSAQPPFILVTDTDSEEMVVRCIRSGAHDYVRKSHLARLREAVSSALTDRMTEQEHRETETTFRHLVEKSLVGVYIIQDGRFRYVNPKMAEIFGYTQQEILAECSVMDLVAEDDRELVRANIQKRIEGRARHLHYRFRGRRKDGATVNVEVLGSATEFNGKPAVIGTLLDLSDRTQLEEHLRHVQKIDTIGTLARGIAHDFNNILGIILGYSRLLLDKRTSPEKTVQGLEAIRKAGERGSALVQQLLTFARKNETFFCETHINTIVEELLRMLQATFPKTIGIECHLAEGLPPVSADAGQIHQALLNLCINARDAMPEGGVLTLRTTLVSHAEVAGRYPDAEESAYVLIAVGDTGIGMSEKTRVRIFEPFFTSKQPGKGTGLGLAVVYGIVRGHRGIVDVSSVPGQGSAFRVYIPATTPQAPLLPTGNVTAVNESPGGSETILVIEDESMLATLLATLLEGKGYYVLTAHDGPQGVATYNNHKAAIDLVLIDIGLPKMNGFQVLKNIRGVNPSVRTILASGYLNPEDKERMMEMGVDTFLQKPFIPSEVLRVVRRVLDRSGFPPS